MKLAIFTILIMSIPFAFGANLEWKRLDGEYAVSPRYYIDPSKADENTHFRMEFIGQSAKDLYELMDTGEEIDQCTGELMKKIDSMQCFFYKAKGIYKCHFSINVPEQSIEFGIVC